MNYNPLGAILSSHSPHEAVCSWPGCYEHFIVRCPRREGLYCATHRAEMRKIVLARRNAKRRKNVRRGPKPGCRIKPIVFADEEYT